jgi:GTP-binding protein EngB required for normal cell division
MVLTEEERKSLQLDIQKELDEMCDKILQSYRACSQRTVDRVRGDKLEFAKSLLAVAKHINGKGTIRSYLFCGPTGVGKSTLINLFCKNANVRVSGGPMAGTAFPKLIIEERGSHWKVIIDTIGFGDGTIPGEVIDQQFSFIGQIIDKIDCLVIVGQRFTQSSSQTLHKIKDILDICRVESGRKNIVYIQNKVESEDVESDEWMQECKDCVNTQFNNLGIQLPVTIGFIRMLTSDNKDTELSRFKSMLDSGYSEIDYTPSLKEKIRTYLRKFPLQSIASFVLSSSCSIS